MLHLIGFDDLDSATAEAFLTVYARGDTCVFLDQGHLVAVDFPLQGPGYLLDDNGPAPTRTADLEIIDYDQLVTLIVDQGPVTSWYPTDNL